MAMAKKQGGFFSSSAPAPSSEWPDKAVSILLKTYAQKFSIDRGYLRTQDWQEVAFAVNSVCDHHKTMKQCRDKVDSLKRRYKIEKRKAVTGGEVSWPFFHRLDGIMNSVLKQGKMQSSAHPNASSAHASADADDGDDVDIVDEAVDEVVGTQERCGNAGVDASDDDGDGDDKDALHSHNSLSASSDIPPYDKPSRRAEDDYAMSEEEDNALNGYSYQRLHRPLYDVNCRRRRAQQRNCFRIHYRQRSKHEYHHEFLQSPLHVPSRPSTGTQESTDNAKDERVKRSVSRMQKRKLECDNGIDALAEAVTGLAKPRLAASFSDMFARIEHAKMEILKKLRLEMTQLDKRHKRSSTSRKTHRSMSTTC